MERLGTYSLITRAAVTLALLLATAGGALAEPPAASKGAVSGEVLVVLAKEEAGEIDARLRKIGALRKPPFSSFKSMQVLSTTAVTIDDGKAATVKLPNGRRLQITLVERMADGRHKVQVAINRPNQKDYLPLLTVIASKEPFFVAGQKHAGGTLVIGVRIGDGAGGSKGKGKGKGKGE
jgi:hypothetical protein